MSQSLPNSSTENTLVNHSGVVGITLTGISRRLWCQLDQGDRIDLTADDIASKKLGFYT